MNNETAMTIEQAELIWQQCYGETNANALWAAWERYDERTRAEALRVRDAATLPSWGVWVVTDRH